MHTNVHTTCAEIPYFKEHKGNIRNMGKYVLNHWCAQRISQAGKSHQIAWQVIKQCTHRRGERIQRWGPSPRIQGSAMDIKQVPTSYKCMQFHRSNIVPNNYNYKTFIFLMQYIVHVTWHDEWWLHETNNIIKYHNTHREISWHTLMSIHRRVSAQPIISSCVTKIAPVGAK